MRKKSKRIWKLFTVLLLMISMGTVTVSGATAKAAGKVRFRTAVINKMSITSGAAVQIVRGDATLDAFEGMRLNSGDTVRTVGDANLYILVDQNKIIRLDKDTEVVLNDTLLGKKVRMTLVKGSMFFNVVEKLPEDESLQFVYGNITISVRGTAGVQNVKDGIAVVMMVDGLIDLTEQMAGGGTVTTPVEAGQKFEYAEGSSITGAKSASRISSFTLSELPPVVVEEMKNDPALKERVISSVPLTNGPDGRTFASPDQVDLNTVSGSKGADAMEPSEAITKIARENAAGTAAGTAETEDGSSGEGSGGGTSGEDPEEDPEDDPGDDPEDDPGEDPADDPGEEPEDDPGEEPEDDPGEEPEDDPGDDPEDDPGEDPEDDPGEEPENDPGDDPEDDPGDDPEDDPGEDPEDDPGEDPEDKPSSGRMCPNCSRLITGDEVSTHFLPCGHTSCQEGFESHDLLPCGSHYACSVAETERYRHEQINENGDTMCRDPETWTYCPHCKQYIKTAEYTEADHSLAECGKHYRCAEDFEESEHGELMDCGHYPCDEEHTDHGELDCGCGRYACSDDPEWFGHGKESRCGHFVCLNIMHWREHLYVNWSDETGWHEGYLCELEEAEVTCPLCDGVTTASELKDENGGHMFYDSERKCFTCCGEPQRAADFRAAFLRKRFAGTVDMDYILEKCLKIELVDVP